MPGNTYKTRALVLRKTRLSEKDLIVTLLDERGELVKCVAKGARKPGGSFAAKLELFSLVDLMLARGRNLDVVSDARLAHDAPPAFGLEQTACASALAELLCTLGQEGLPHGRLFDMSSAAFRAISSLDPADALALTAASLLKALAMAGFRPSFAVCVSCGERLGLSELKDPVPFSVAEGGVVCGRCATPEDATQLDPGLLQWCNALMLAPFEDVPRLEADAGTSFSVLELVGQWTRMHAGRNLKSLEFLFSCGLF